MQKVKGKILLISMCIFVIMAFLSFHSWLSWEQYQASVRSRKCFIKCLDGLLEKSEASRSADEYIALINLCTKLCHHD